MPLWVWIALAAVGLFAISKSTIGVGSTVRLPVGVSLWKNAQLTDPVSGTDFTFPGGTFVVAQVVGPAIGFPYQSSEGLVTLFTQAQNATLVS